MVLYDNLPHQSTYIHTYCDGGGGVVVVERLYKQQNSQRKFSLHVTLCSSSLSLLSCLEYKLDHFGACDKRCCGRLQILPLLLLLLRDESENVVQSKKRF